MLPLQTGLTYSDPARVTPGLTLIAPMQGDTVFLIDEATSELRDTAVEVVGEDGPNTLVRIADGTGRMVAIGRDAAWTDGMTVKLEPLLGN